MVLKDLLRGMTFKGRIVKTKMHLFTKEPNNFRMTTLGNRVVSF